MSLSARTVCAGRTRRPRARLRVQIRRNNAADESNSNRFARVACFPGRNVRFARSRSWRRTIAPFMLAPCSASSMLFASLRPGRRPGLRALTTPPRGTSWAFARWWLLHGSTRARDEVDARFAQAYVDVSRLCRTAHPPHRTQCMRSAFPVVALRARFKRTPQHRVWCIALHAARERAHT